MLALIAGSSGFTLAPTAVPRQLTRVVAANVVMQTMADLRFFVSGSEARTTLAVVVCDGLAGSQRPPVSHLSAPPCLPSVRSKGSTRTRASPSTSRSSSPCSLPALVKV